MEASPPRADLSCVADRHWCYPGETVTLFTRVAARADQPGFTLRVILPPEVNAGAHASSPGADGLTPDQVVFGSSREVTWRVERAVPAGTRVDVELALTARPVSHDLTLECLAVLDLAAGQAEAARLEATADILVLAQGRYLRYLPGIYHEDELMGRLLMLFESFWDPIERQIDNAHNYFDPRLAPARLLPWLASWVDLAMDERWPEARRRQLLGSAVSLYRKRGTRRGLEEFLEIYTGYKPEITESRARNFRLGASSDSVLGSGVALGTSNMPHTFQVRLRLPPVPAADDAERARLEAARQRQIERLIEAEKPAHTRFTLKVEPLEAGAPDRA